jgi:glycosyltransferase involved in cell wall biosynthesis
MRILMLSPYIPWPLHGGGRIRIYYLLKEMARHGHEIVLLAGSPDPGTSIDPAISSLLEEVRLFWVPQTGGLSAYFRSLLSKAPYPASQFAPAQLRESWNALVHSQDFDLIWVNFTIMGGILATDPRKDAVVVLEEHESQELVWRDFIQHGSAGQRVFACLNLLKLRRFENRVLSHVDAVFSVSDPEADLMRQRVPAGVEVLTVPNGADTDYYQPIPLAKRDPNTILLSGNMSVKRNIDAVFWFVDGVFPAIRSTLPEAQLLIVGADPAAEIRALAQRPGIKVSGTVADMRDYHARSRVTVAPYRFGAGTKLKVVEAMACGTPLVSTSIGCHGLDVCSGEHLLIADAKIEFADSVIGLMRDEQLAESLASAARNLAEAKYSWRSIVASLEPKVEALVQSHSRTAVREHVPATAEEKA